MSSQSHLYECPAGHYISFYDDEEKIDCPFCIIPTRNYKPLKETSPEIDFVELMLKRTPKCTTSNTSLAQ